MSTKIIKKIWVVLIALCLTVVFINPKKVLAFDGPVSSLEDNGGTYIGRDFDPNFDRLFDELDWRGQNGSPTYQVPQNTSISGNLAFDLDTPYALVNYSPTVGVDVEGSPIFKAGSSANIAGASYNYWITYIRGTNGADINDLAVGFRYDDDHDKAIVNYVDLKDADLETPVQFDGTWQKLVINISDTVDGLFYNPGNIPAGGQLAGVHIYNKNTVDGSGTISIKLPFWSKNASIDAITSTGDTASASDYWSNFDQHVVNNALEVLPANSIPNPVKIVKTDLSVTNSDSAYDYINFKAKGASDYSLKLYKEDGTSTVKSHSELLYEEGKHLPELKNSTYTNITVPLLLNGYSKEIVGFEIINNSTTQSIYVSQISFTNLEIVTPADSYPTLSSDVLPLDTFNRNTLGATPNYVEVNQVAQENNLAYIISYHGIDNLEVASRELLMSGVGIDYTSLEFYNLTNFADKETNPYLVFKMSNRSSSYYNDFRFEIKLSGDTKAPGTYYLKDLYAAPGLKTIPDDIDHYEYRLPYHTYFIVDIRLLPNIDTVQGLTLYYSGEGNIGIDEIFAAHLGDPTSTEAKDRLVIDFENGSLDQAGDLGFYWANFVEAGEGTAVIENGALHLTSTSSFLQSAFGAPVDDFPYIEFVIKNANPNATGLQTFRFGRADQVSWFKDNLWVDYNGVPVKDISDTYQRVVIDTGESGIEESGASFRFFAGEGFDVLIDSITFSKKPNILWSTKGVIDDFENTSLENRPGAWWSDLNGIQIANGTLTLGGDVAFSCYGLGHPQLWGKTYIAFEVTPVGESADLGNLRIAANDNSKTVWAHSLVLDDGSFLGSRIITGTTTLYINLLASGFEYTNDLRIFYHGDAIKVDNLVGYKKFVIGEDLEGATESYRPEGRIIEGNDVIYAGENWYDAGVETPLWVSHSTSGSVNTNVPGEYIITYTLTNLGYELVLIRIVTVLEPIVVRTVTLDYEPSLTTIYVNDGELLTKPADPFKPGYIFLGWYTTRTGNTQYDFSTPVVSNITIYAHFEEIKYTVTIHYNDETDKVDTLTCNTTTIINEPGFTRKGYKLVGYYEDAQFTRKHSFDGLVTSDLDLYAKWEKESGCKKGFNVIDVAIFSLISSISLVGLVVILKKKH